MPEKRTLPPEGRPIAHDVLHATSIPLPVSPSIDQQARFKGFRKNPDPCDVRGSRTYGAKRVDAAENAFRHHVGDGCSGLSAFPI